MLHTYLIKIVSHKDEVYTTESKLGDYQKNIYCNTVTIDVGSNYSHHVQ